MADSDTAPTGLFQRLAYLLVMLAMRRAAKQIRDIKEAEAAISDGDDEKLARHAERVATARTAAEQRLRTLRLDLPREDLAAALTDAMTWSDSSEIARTALDKLIAHYDLNYGLKISTADNTVGADPGFVGAIDAVQATIERAAVLQREQAASDAVSHLLSSTYLSATDHAQASAAITAWAADPADIDALEPDAVRRRRDQLEQQLTGTGLSDHDRAQTLFLVDYLTGHATDTSLDLLDTPVFLPAPPPATTEPPHPMTGSDPATGLSATSPGETGPAPTGEHRSAGEGGQQRSGNRRGGRRSKGGRDEAAAAGANPGQGQGAGDATPFSGAGDEAGPSSGAARGSGPAPEGDSGQSGPPQPGPVGPTLPPNIPGPGTAAGPGPAVPPGPEPVDREQLSALLRDYLGDVTTAHRHAEEVATGRAQPSDDMLTLVDGIRDKRHQLVAAADHGHGLTPIERTQIRAVLHDIDTGKTELPILLWVDEPTKREADTRRHRHRGSEIASEIVTEVTEVLDKAQIFAPSDPLAASRLPTDLHEPLRDALTALRDDSGPIDQRRTDFMAATREFVQKLDDLAVEGPARDETAQFIRRDIAGERYATHPERVITRLTQLLDSTGILIDPDKLPRTDAATVTATMNTLHTVVTQVATDNDNRDRLLRRYQTAVNDLGQHLLDTGVDPGTRVEVHTIIKNHARRAHEHALRGRERRTRWAERSLPNTATGSAHTSADPPRNGPAPGTQRPTARTQRFTPTQRRRQIFQNFFRPHHNTRRSART
ncbi:hypothetical protein ACFWPH_28205 [Nocardia sp. NPDC058499]|uniref:hypothetical protein n=1 Tax=Nocardia sp. NPDC058499 TaxID=3346530 RepID=UPI00365E64B6